MSTSAAPAPPSLAINIVLVGAGKMGGALLEGWIGLGIDPTAVTVIEPQPSPQIAALAARVQLKRRPAAPPRRCRRHRGKAADRAGSARRDRRPCRARRRRSLDHG